MFETFTDRARRVIVLAQEQARELNHSWIGTEHLLAGLVRVEGGVAHKLLTAEGFDQDLIRTRIVEIDGQGSQEWGGHIPFTPRTKKVLSLSLQEALQMGHNYIGTEHILLGITREGGGKAVQILTGSGAEIVPELKPSLDEWRLKVLKEIEVALGAMYSQGAHALMPDESVFVPNLLDALVDFSKRTGASWTINLPGGNK